MNIEKLKARAKDYATNEDWGNLKKICTQVIKHPSAKDDDKVCFFIYRAEAYRNQGNHGQAIKDLTEVIDRGLEPAKNIKAYA